MTIQQITNYLETIAPPHLQESYDNAGLLTGNPAWKCTGILCCLDSIEAVVDEAIFKNCNLIVAHHPIIFGGIKKITGSNYIEKTLIKAIKNDIAIYAIHTNLDNVIDGVNGKIAAKLGLVNLSILSPKPHQLCKLYFFVPATYSEKLMAALFAAGGGNIANYSECSFTAKGVGTFKPNEKATPFSGEIGKRQQEEELKIEIIFPTYLKHKIISTLLQNHPYEEVAYEIITVDNLHQQIGSGLVGEFENPLTEQEFLSKLKQTFHLQSIKHTALSGRMIKKISLCGGAGIFLLKKAINAKSDAYITADVKYHEFFDAENSLVLADIGHYESEQFTIEYLVQLLEDKFPNFAVLKTGVNTNPVQYF